MRLCATVLVLSFAALAGCDGGPTAPAGPPPAAQPPAPAGPAQPGEPASPSRPSAAPAGPLRIDGAAEGALRFDGFGPVRFGDDAQAVRQAWGGDLGAAGPVEPGGCHYLIPSPWARRATGSRSWSRATGSCGWTWPIRRSRPRAAPAWAWPATRCARCTRDGWPNSRTSTTPTGGCCG